MAKNHCVLIPEVNGEASQLYTELVKLTKNKPLANLIYAHYSSLGVGAKMDSKGFIRNKQGQHSAKDVYSFFDVGSMITESTDLYRARKEAGSVDSHGNTIKYQSAKEALELAQKFNNTHNGTVASVYQNGDYFSILVNTKDSRTQIKKAEVEKQLQLWEVLEQSFKIKGVELSSLDFARATINPTNIPQFLNYLENLSKLPQYNWGLLTQRDLQVLFTISRDLPQVQRLMTKFGTLEEVAQKIFNVYKGVDKVTQGERSLIDTAIKESLKLNGLDISKIKDTIANLTQEYNSSSNEVTIQDELDILNKKYKIGNIDFKAPINKIKTLQQAAIKSVVTLKRQIDQLEKQRGITEEGKRIESTLKILMKELQSNNFYAGTLNFLKEAAIQIQTIDSLLKEIPTNGTVLENSIEGAKALMKIKSIIDGYYEVVESLSNMDSLIIDEGISDHDKNTLQEQAKELSSLIEKRKKVLNDLKKSIMLDVCTEVLGNTTPEGVAIANIIEIQDTDCSIFDYLYSVGRLSDPVVGVMGKVIRDAQDSRNKKMSDIALRIRRATNALFKSGIKSTEFMYDTDNRIISDIDWESYYKARKEAINSFKKSGKRGFDLKDAIEQWEDANTEDRVVDYESGRAERIPSSMYRKEFPKLTEAQLEYYNTMMQIKGELGTLLPQFAQQQYIPPQKRRSFSDAIASSKNAKDVAKAIWNKISNLWIIREDDTSYTKNAAVFDGRDYNISESDFNNNPIKNIPIFFINRLENQEELMKDFSGALQSLAGTAINYDAMSKIQDLIELMGDYVRNDRQLRYNKNNIGAVDIIEDQGITVYQELTNKAKSTNTVAIMDSFIDQHLYGKKIQDEESQKLSLFIRNLVNYRSVTALALNLKGAISNYLVGELSMLIEAGGSEFYNLTDYSWAHTKLFGGPSQAGRIMGIMTNDRNSKEYLLSTLFDPINDTFQESSQERYYRNVFRQLMHGDFTFLGYKSGEYLIHYVTMYAMLNHEKVTVDGKEMSLYDAFTVGNKESGNSELIFKGKEVKDKDGNIINDEWLENFKRRIRYANQSTHGSMNDEDKGVIHQKLYGKLVMNFRQWMVEHYSRRYRKSHYDASLGEWREGYWRTYGKFVQSWIQGLTGFTMKAALKWDDMNEMQKSNVRRCLTEQILLASLFMLSKALGEPEDHKKEFWYRMWIYQTKRALRDINASNPFGAALEFKSMINSPISVISTINGFLYPIVGIGDIDKTIKRGPHKGENTYWRNIKKYTLPFWKDIDQIRHMDEDESIFAIFSPYRMY